MNLRERVQHERKMRGLSRRSAAILGGTSNQTWGTWENGGNLTDGVRLAVSKAFDWPMDWPENPPAVTQQPDAVAALQEQLATLISTVQTLSATVRAQGAELAQIREQRSRRGS